MCTHSAGMRIAGACRRFARRIESIAERERDRRVIAERERLVGGEGGLRGGGDSLPGPILIVPGNEGVIK